MKNTTNIDRSPNSQIDVSVKPELIEDDNLNGSAKTSEEKSQAEEEAKDALKH